MQGDLLLVLLLMKMSTRRSTFFRRPEMFAKHKTFLVTGVVSVKLTVPNDHTATKTKTKNKKRQNKKEKGKSKRSLLPS